jgi:hypothetical protein
MWETMHGTKTIAFYRDAFFTDATKGVQTSQLCLVCPVSCIARYVRPQ